MVTATLIKGAPLRAPGDASAFDDLDRFGFCLLQGALSGEAMKLLKTRIDAQAAGEAAAGEGFFDSEANQRLWMLPNKGRAFRDLVMAHLVETMMGRLLGPKFLLSSLTANIARPGGTAMFLHSDQGYVDFWTERPLVANMLFMLDDFTEANGATRVVPGSHLERPLRRRVPEETIAAEGPAGTVMVFDGRLVHGTGANRSADQHRRAILAYHCRPFVRQQENYFLGLDPDLRRSERPDFLARLGFEIWAGLGRTNSPAEKRTLEPLARPIGPLGPDGRPAREDPALPNGALAGAPLSS